MRLKREEEPVSLMGQGVCMRLNQANHLIFVSIAAYRDPQLVPTMEDCIAKARHPERLRFGICWQHDPRTDTLPFLNDDCFRILAVDWLDSQGVCWARCEVMEPWRGGGRAL